MPYATGPWHTPPHLPDEAGDLCLVLLFGLGKHHRYEVMSFQSGIWSFQDGTPLPPDHWVSRWAYVAASIERMSELAPVTTLPIESRLFVPGQLTDHERTLLLVAFVDELKHELARSNSRNERAERSFTVENQLAGKVRMIENERKDQLASRDKKIAEQRDKLLLLEQRLRAAEKQCGTANALVMERDQLRAQLVKEEQRSAGLNRSMHALKEQLKQMVHKSMLTEAVAKREERITNQRKELAAIEGKLAQLRAMLANAARKAASTAND